MNIVLVTTGKHDSVDTVAVRFFDERGRAEQYCESLITGETKYWTYAEIVDEGYTTELAAPDWGCL